MSIGTMQSGWARDLKVCAADLGRAIFKASRGDYAGANTLIDNVITNITALKVPVSTATKQSDLSATSTLTSPTDDPR